MKPITDVTLWNLVKEDQSNAFGELYDRYWEQLYTTVYWRVCDEDVAKDIVQEVFINIWEKRKSIDIQDSVVGYLKISAKHKVLNYFKSEATRQRHYQNAGALHEKTIDSTTHEIAAKETSKLYHDEIDRLPEKMKEIFLLSRRENLNIEQIANRLLLSPQTVKNQLTSALKKIKQGMG